MATVELRNCQKFFGKSEILSGVSVDIKDGEFFVLVGPSGCGKSTLLRMVAGLEEISTGEIAINGGIVNDVAAKDRDVALVFQSYALYPHKTVAENMGFSLLLAKRPRDEIKMRVWAAAEILGLEKLLDRFPKQLSGGQRQRVAMGRAIVRNPKVFLFDEPMSNLDAKLRLHMRTEIKKLHQRLGTTSIYVTNDQVEAMTMADRIMVMRDGKVEQIGTPAELYNNPRNMFVAGFIGSPPMNFIRGEVFKTSGDCVFAAAPDIRLPLPVSEKLKDGHEIVFGVRPQHFNLCDQYHPFACRITVDVVEPTGDDSEVSGWLGGNLVSISLPGEKRLQPGEGLFVMPEIAKGHLFDANSKQRLEV